MPKAKIESRLATFGAKLSSEGHSASGKQRDVDLIKAVSLERDAVNGTWVIDHDQLVCADAAPAVIEFDYVPPEEYDFVVQFTRKSGHEQISQICSAQGHRFDWAMGAWEATVSGLQAIDGKTCRDNPTHSTVGMEINHRYTSIVKIRKDGISVFLDGKRVAVWKTDFKDMSLQYGSNSVRHPNTLALLAAHTPTVFHSAKIVELSGPGKRLTQNPDDGAKTSANPIPTKLKIAGTYTIVSKHNGLFLAVDGGGTNQGTVAVASPNPGNDQFWSVEPLPGGSFRLLNKKSGHALAIRQDLKDSGTDAILWGWGGGDGQQWLIEPLAGSYAKIVNKNSNLCLSVGPDGRHIVQESWQNRDTQLWKADASRKMRLLCPCGEPTMKPFRLPPP